VTASPERSDGALAGDVGIRPYRIEDAEASYEAIVESKAELMPWMPWCAPDYALEAQRKWVEERTAAFANRESFEFAIVAPSGRYLGGCGLNFINWAERRANLGYWVRTSAAGRGVATRATRLLAAWGFAETDLERLEILIATANAASVRVAEKAGARREGTLRKRIRYYDVQHDAAVFSFVRGDLE
jgi:RimJ/RimL family protein N-acetyltransferase